MMLEYTVLQERVTMETSPRWMNNVVELQSKRNRLFIDGGACSRSIVDRSLMRS